MSWDFRNFVHGILGKFSEKDKFDTRGQVNEENVKNEDTQLSPPPLPDMQIRPSQTYEPFPNCPPPFFNHLEEERYTVCKLPIPKNRNT